MIQSQQTKAAIRARFIVATVPQALAGLFPQRPNGECSYHSLEGRFHFAFVRGSNRFSTTAHNRNTMAERAARPIRDAVRILGCRAEARTLLLGNNSVRSLGPVPAHPMRYGHFVVRRLNVAPVLRGISPALLIKSRGRKNGACVSKFNLGRSA